MMKTRKVPHPGWNLEYMMWLFTRISGLAFFLLAIIGLLGALYMGARLQMNVGTIMRWTFFPNISHVQDSNIPDTEPWAMALWQIFQILILFFGGTHGLNGLRVVLEDYVQRPGLQMLLRFVIFLVWIIMLLLSIYVVVGSY
jgi:succinate dehydrogenase / fumarate reductase, membrane anchor subunit